MPNGDEKGLDAIKAPLTYGEWVEAIKTLPKAEKEKFIAALTVLEQWEDFNDAFGWTRMFFLKAILYLY